jgi:hypothetical protein
MDELSKSEWRRSRRLLKLLVATEFPPNASGGGPAVVRQMLRGWPTEGLFWWNCLPERDTRFGQVVGEASCAPIPPKLMPQRRFAAFKSALLDHCWAPYASAHLARTIRRLRPDVVWVIPHNWSILPAAAILPNIGVGYHVTMQDYVDVHGQLQKFGPARCRRMAALADRLYASATTRDATSHPMTTDLRERTQAAAAQMLHAGLEEGDFHFLADRKPASDSTIRIAYAGTILAPREFALFAAALHRVRPRLAGPVSLELFGAHSYAGEPWFDAGWMREHGNLPDAELLTALRNCTWGFAPMSLTDHDPRYNRFSFPTKFITYLAAGLPVITLGHPESSVMQMAARYRVGLATSAGDLETLARQLDETLTAQTPWLAYGAEIIRCAGIEFDATRMRAVLHGCFETCSEATRKYCVTS